MQGATFLALMVFHDPKTIEIRNVGDYSSYFGCFPRPKTPKTRNVGATFLIFGGFAYPYPLPLSPPLNPSNKKCKGALFLILMVFHDPKTTEIRNVEATFLALVVFHDPILMVFHDPKTIETRNVGDYSSYFGCFPRPKTPKTRNVGATFLIFGGFAYPYPLPLSPPLNPSNKKCKGALFLILMVFHDPKTTEIRNVEATFLALVVFHDLILMVFHDPKTIEIRNVGGYVSYFGVGGYVSYSDGFQIHDPKTIKIRKVGVYGSYFWGVRLPLSPTP